MKKSLIVLFLLAGLALAGVYFWQQQQLEAEASAFIKGNGRLEATEIDIATKLAGRLEDVLVSEGEFVSAGQILAIMQIQSLEAQRREAQAQHKQAINGVASAEAQLNMRISDKTALQAQVRRAEADLNAAQSRLARTQELAKKGVSSEQTLDDDLARQQSAEAAVAAAKAQVTSAEAAIVSARSQIISAESQVDALAATLERIQVEIDDSQLKAPRAGRVQFRLAQPGEVLGAGGKVLNMLDLSDVYMTFFMPTEVAGRLALGAEVRLVLDALPNYVIPAKISFVASAAQFTPKTVETASERQKLMFRVRAQIDRELLLKYLEYVKTGLPGEAWVRLDPTKDWPSHLQLKAEN